jgi:uncharacterized protein YydD (DUF2326 family)
MIKSRKVRCNGHETRKEEKRNAYGLFVVNAEGKRPLGTPRRRQLNDIKMDLGEIGWSID